MTIYGTLIFQNAPTYPRKLADHAAIYSHKKHSYFDPPLQILIQKKDDGTGTGFPYTVVLA